ncbi:hypothetical protein EG68_05999 [Paragonimus skrjabini miyazakii]|uniref:Protein DGCR14 n=1 Tax=Paragonimus skrjabini miyazakii TaxID=59628 RepID=A0A8S9YWE7_9TREM|nr:hypothetical protein EG68_05999 [Paragonimus skrjabini miyazakii]
MDRVSSKLVTDFDGHKKLVTYNAIRGKVVIQTVQEEEEYMEHLGTIIQRDYFPDLASIRGGPVTPSNPDSAAPSIRSANKSSKVDTHNPEQVDPTSFSLDKYLANNTTEDDASFAELIEETEKKHRIGLSSFFPSIQAAASSPDSDESKPLGLPGGSHVHVGPRLSLTGSNAVHFNPDGVAHTQDEFLDHLANDRRIVPSNTRFKRPLPPAVDKRSLAKQLVLHKLGHIGLDGKESQSALSTPQTGGFKFLDASPSPAPSALGASPFMTWGELDATPSRLDDGALTPTVASGAPAFRIPSPSKREQLAHQLADKAGRQRVRDRNEAVRRVHSGVPSPATRSLLSPAARRLLASSSSILHSGGGSRPGTGSSHTCFANSPLTKSHTPRRLPSDLGVVRRPTSGRSTSVCPSPASTTATEVTNYKDQKIKTKSDTMSLETTEVTQGLNESITDNLLNLRTPHH